MTLLQQAVQWLNDPLNWTNPGGIIDRLVEHLRISVAAVLLGCLIAIPLLPYVEEGFASLGILDGAAAVDFHLLFNLALAALFLFLTEPVAR